MSLPLLIPDWPAPRRVRAASTTRLGGVSGGEFASLNLALHVGDEPAAVETNRQTLFNALQLKRSPLWLNQVHGCGVVNAADESAVPPSADASWTTQPGRVCAVMTADCLPVLFCDDDATVVASAHAGWRGLAGGVLESTLAALPVAPQNLMAWLGPAIGPKVFEVGGDVRAAFVAEDAGADLAFTSLGGGKFLCDLYALARRRLLAAGVARIYGGERCTYSEADTFFSYRRDGRCGRMASLIWLAD